MKIIDPKLAYNLFIISAIIFVARPFISFNFYGSLFHSAKPNSIFVKSFIKCKPECFDEASTKKKALSLQLINPPLHPLATISELLNTLFVFFLLIKTARHFPKSRPCFGRPIYLVTGKLII